MKKESVTINDVAKHAGFSKSVVSNYLNNKYGTMTSETKQKIKQAIEELNYIPNTKYRNFKPKETGMIGLIIPDITDQFYSLICKGILDAGLENNYNILIANSDNNIVRENQYIENFLEITDGIIVGSVGRNEKILLELENKIPVVLLDRRMQTLKYDVVSSNNYEAIQDMMQYLVGTGYEAFGMFVEELIEGTSRRLRYQSYIDFIETNNLQEVSFVHIVKLFDENLFMRELINFLNKTKTKKTAVICANGRTLLHLLSAVNSLKLKIPEELGVCGYDDFEAAALIHNGITSINQPTYEIGYKCLEQIIKRINNKGDFIPKEINLRSKLVIRGSL